MLKVFASSRLASIVAMVLLSGSFAVRAASEDLVLRLRSRLVLPGCISWAEPEYTVDDAIFVTFIERDKESCDSDLAMTVTVTMTREEHSFYRQDSPATVTSTAECPEETSCEIRVSMPHPNIEDAHYSMEWFFLRSDGWWGWKGEGDFCESYMTVANCGPFDYWFIRIPDP